jgi:signal transduction histidine kinase
MRSWRLRSLWRRRTLAFRVTATVGVLMLGAVALLAYIAYQALDSELTGTVDAELHSVVEGATPIVAAGRPLPYGGERGEPPQVRVLDTAGRPADGGPSPGFDRADVRNLLAGAGVFTEVDGTTWRWVGAVTTLPDGSQRLVVAGTDLVGQVTLLRRAGNVIIGSAALFAVLVAAATWLAVRSALLPVRRMRKAAAALPEGHRLPVPPADDELRGLAKALNELLARRDESAAKLRQFTGDAAHELRTPVAAIRVQAEVAVAHPDPALAAETLADVAAESERLTTMLNDLLALARADAGERQPSCPVDLSAAARTAIARLPSTGRTAGVDPTGQIAGVDPTGRVDVRLTAPAPVVVSAAPADVARVLDNLLANAVRHAATMVRVSVLPHVRSARIWVDDDGPGIPAGHRELVFHRFHRLNDDRSRGGSAGAGLGLALVAETVHRYGGTVAATASPEGGARLEIRWPT